MGTLEKISKERKKRMVVNEGISTELEAIV